MEMQQCRRCKTERPAVEMSKGGWCSTCIEKQREATRRFYVAHRNEIRDRQNAAYREKHGGTVRSWRPEWPVGMKGCSRCNTVKPLSDFRPDAQKRFGVVAYCRDCERAYHRQRGKTMTPEQRRVHNERVRQWAKSPRGSRLQYAKQIKRLYGLTMEQYETMLDQQGQVCAICHKPETRVLRGKVARLCVDHDHTDGHVRALVCHRCNRTVELLEENPDLARQMMAYLQHHGLRLVDTNQTLGGA